MPQAVPGQAWFTGPGMTHPLADPALAQALISRHSTGDAVAVLDRIGSWVGELDALSEVALTQRFEVLDLLDRHAKNHQIGLVPEYLESARLRKLSESALWATSFGFWKAIGDAYLHCLDRYQANPAGETGFVPRLPILVGRILRTLTLQLKWTLLRHGQVDPHLWQTLGRCFRFAEEGEFASLRIAVYQSRHGESSAREELLKMLMLSISAPDALAPVQQHIAERIIAYFGDRFELSRLPAEGRVFMFDLAEGSAPKRFRNISRPPTLARFFGPGSEVRAALAVLQEDLTRLGALPPYFGIGPNYARDDIAAVLDHLARCWTDDSPARLARRQESTASLTVVPGLADNARWLTQLLTTSRAPLATPPSADTWQVCDASEHGCGAQINGRPPEWLGIGVLIGVRTGETGSVRMAIVRRILDDATDRHRIGLQLLGDAAAPVALFPPGATHAGDPARTGEAALLLSSRLDADSVIELLVRAEGIGDNKALQMRFLDRIHRLEPVRTIEKGRGFRLASFRIAAG